MTPYQKRLTPLTKRLAEDLKIRHRAAATIDAYTYHVQRFADFTKKPLDRATPQDVRNFQLHLLEVRKVGYSSFNQAVCALRFLYTTTLPRKWPVRMIPFGKRPKKLPTVLCRQEVDDLLRCTPNLKHRTIFMTLYGAGLRLSEAAHLKIADIDSARMQLNIACGKGAKQRLVPLSPRLLTTLREYWKQYRPAAYLFPGKTPDKPYGHQHPESNQGVGGAGRDQEVRPSARAEAFLRHGVAGSGRGYPDDQSAVGARLVLDHDGLLARSPGTSPERSESAGLAAGETTSRLATTAPGQSEKLTVAEILRVGAAQYVNRASSPVAPQVQARWRSCRCVAPRRWVAGTTSVWIVNSRV